MLLAGEPNIREVVLFPMNQRAEDLMMNAPGEVSARQLRELHIRLVEPPKADRIWHGLPSPFGLSLSKPFPSLSPEAGSPSTSSGRTECAAHADQPVGL